MKRSTTYLMNLSISFLTILSMLVTFNGNSQCTLGDADGTFNTTTLVNDVATDITTTLNAGKYVTLNNIVAGKTYVLSSCLDPANTSLTLFNSLFTSIAFSTADCDNDGEITFIAPSSGTYYIQLNVGNCLNDAISHTIKVTRLGCTNPEPADITITQNVTCFGDSAILSFAGNLYDAEYWVVYIDSCGGGVLDTTFTNTFTFVPEDGTRKYFVRGEGGCLLTLGECDSITMSAVYNNAYFSYAASSYCVQSPDPTPIITGVTGGSFNATPAGLSLSSTTGTVDLSASNSGVYKIYYTTPGICPNTDSVLLEIIGLDDVTFSYSSVSYCKGSTDPLPTVTGVSGGTFSSTPAGLSISATNGVINLDASTAGTYTVNYTTLGICGNTSSRSVTINNIDVASISYASNSYCVNSTDPTPTITGVTGGTFSSSTGLSINATTGAIDVSASTPGFYNITYTTLGSCPVSNLFILSINSLDNANFDYGKTTFCTTDSDPMPSVFVSGTFSSLPTGLSINSSNGSIDISASTNAVYIVTYTTTGTCPNSSSKSISISSLDNANFSYAGTTYCPSGTDPTPTITGLSGGTFSFAPFGMLINTSTGTIDLSGTIPKSYSVTYTTNGSCPNSASQSIVLNPSDDASFNYANSNFCLSSSDQTPTITGLIGGVFSATPTGLSLNPSTGFVDISASTLGNYSVTYTTNGVCPTSMTRNFSISNLDNASFNYSNASFCAFETNTTPTISGALGGTFTSSPVGLSLSGITGFINTGSSNEGTYTVTYTTNGDCVNFSNQSVTIVAVDDASFYYNQVEYCDSETDPLPIIDGFPVGNFSALPSGLVINSSSGQVDLDASVANLYTITYLTSGSCPNTSSKSFIVKESSDASFAFSTANYCRADADPSPSINGLSGGVFTSFPSGLVIDTYTGVIDLSASNIGTYNIVYSVTGFCPNSDTVTIAINDYENASFSYSSNNFCTAGSNAFPTISGVVGGTFSAVPMGLSLNATTGEIDVATSTVGNYSITYQTNGICANSSSVALSVSNFDDAGFAYAQGNYCITSIDPTPTVTGLAGGLFTASPTGLSINILTGKIDVSASTPNTYAITYTTTGDCPNSSIQMVDINALDVASFSFANASYCIDGTNPLPTISGLTGGTFASSPVGLDLNTSTGEITLASSSPSNYTVTFTTNGLCPNSSSENISINGLDNASFNYGAGTFCASDANPYPTILGVQVGSFSATPAGLILDANTGEIDVVNSLFASYNVTYTTAGSCPNFSTISVDMIEFDDASFNYSLNTYCISNTNPMPTITGIVGGSFSSSPSGLSINASTGLINLSSSLLGIYTVTYNTVGNCQNSSSQTITITDVDNASFTFGTTNFCEGDVDPIPNITGVTGGVFTSNPSGLIIDGNSGVVDISASNLGNYFVSYTTTTSCPTTNTKVFNLNEIPVSNQIVSACDSININGNYYFSTQIVKDTLAGILCDSIVNTDLTVNSYSFGTDVQSVWCSLIWIDSIEYTESNNTATHILTNALGCDSLVQLDLTISSVDVSVTSTGNSFVANSSTSSYQWLDCNIGYSQLIHETNQTFVPTLNGSFAVVITENLCSDTSECFQILNVGIENNFESNFEIFPNPFSNEINIHSDDFLDYEFTIFNIEGKVIVNETVSNSSYNSISMESIENGIYFVKIFAADKMALFKIVKQ